MGLWSLLLSAKSARETLRKTMTVVQQVQTAVETANAVELQDLRQRAASGDRAAQYEVGERYYTGAGVPQDFSEAARLFEVGAKNGHLKSQITLSMLYAAGRGVDRDLIQALRWIEPAAAKHDATALRFRAKLLARMSPDQIETARQRAKAGSSGL